VQIYTYFYYIKNKKRKFAEIFMSMKHDIKYTIAVNDTSLQKKDVSVLGVVSICVDFVFIARVNRFSKYKFAKSENFSLWKRSKKCNNEFTAYYYDYKEKGCKLIVVNTKNSNNDTLVNDWKDYNNIIIVVGRDNESVAEEIKKNIKKEAKIIDILSIEKEFVVKTVNQVMQMDIFNEVENITTIKQKKQGISLETLDNFLIAVEDYLLNVNQKCKKMFF
jgi:hypothetical protein